jgi:hypothetical protein
MACIYSTPAIQMNAAVDKWVATNCTKIQNNLKCMRKNAEDYNNSINTLDAFFIAGAPPATSGTNDLLDAIGAAPSFRKIGTAWPTDAESDLGVVFSAAAGIDNTAYNLKARLMSLAGDLGALYRPPISTAVANAENANNHIQTMIPLVQNLETCASNMIALNAAFIKVKENAVQKLQSSVQALQNIEAYGGRLTPAQQSDLADLQAQLAALGSATSLGSVLSADQEQVKNTFKEQCFLLAYMKPLAMYKSETVEAVYARALPYVTGDIAETQGNGLVGNNNSLLIDRAPWGFMNRLTQSPEFLNLFEVSNSDLGQLSPYIELKKIVETDDGNIKEVTMNFDASAASDASSILSNKDKRGFGVGIKDFTFSYEGSNPFAVKKSIKAKLVLFASSFDDLLKVRGSKGGYYRYADLAMKTGTNLKDKIPPPRNPEDLDSMNSNIGKLNFRLKAIVGWAPPAKSATSLAAVKGAINHSYVTLTLTPTIHEFDIDDMGRVTFTINYLSYIEDFFDQPNYNIFTDIETNKTMFQRREKYKRKQKECSPSQMANIKKGDAERINFEKALNLRSIALSLLKNEKLYFIEMKYDSMIEFMKKGPWYSWDPSITPPYWLTDEASTQEQKDIVAALEAQYQPNTSSRAQTGIANLDLAEYIIFFYLSDLVDVVLSGIGKLLQGLEAAIGADPDLYGPGDKKDIQKLKESFKNFRVILGPMEIVDPKNPGDMATCSLGDTPISLKYFMDWLTDNTLKKERAEWNLPAFLNALLNNFVRNFLNNDTCYDINIKQKTRIFQNVITAYKNKEAAGAISKNDQITDLILKQRALDKDNPDQGWATCSRLWAEEGYLSLVGGPKPLLNVMGTRGDPRPTIPGGEINYLVYYGGRVQPTELMNGDYTEDANNGIFHYILGRDRGLVKNISLVKTDSPGLKEVRFEQEGYDGLTQLREVYDAKIECYGMPNAVPGTYIYVDPNSFAPGAKNLKNKDPEYRGANQVDPYELTRYGIGGYYMVYHAENSFGPGQCNTKISAKWVAELAKQKIKTAGGAAKTHVAGPATKCKVKG